MFIQNNFQSSDKGVSYGSKNKLYPVSILCGNSVIEPKEEAEIWKLRD